MLMLSELDMLNSFIYAGKPDLTGSDKFTEYTAVFQNRSTLFESVELALDFGHKIQNSKPVDIFRRDQTFSELMSSGPAQPIEGFV